MKQRVLLPCVLLLLTVSLQAQIKNERDLMRTAQGKVVKSDERVSFKADFQYPAAIAAISEVTKKLMNKEILDYSPLANKEGNPIGENIDGMFWRDALEQILRKQGLWYLEGDANIVVNTVENISKMSQTMTPTQQTGTQPTTQQTATQQQMGIPGMPAVVDSGALMARLREVTISAIFLEINQTKLHESGIDFKVFRGSDMNINVEFQGATRVSSDVFSASIAPTAGKTAVNVAAAIKFFESEQYGEILSRPQVTVREGMLGRVQIGQSFSSRSKDFQGNTVEQFYDSGTILEVTPKLYKVGNVQFVVLTLKVEKSSVDPGTISTLINKTIATSTLTMLDGEEAYVGGLYSLDESSVRDGIPLLKDLPWWFFGLRYIFGFDRKSQARKELIVLIKAELVPLIEERAAQRAQKDAMQERLRDNQKDIDRRQGKKP
ncbi:MAG: hypothetical protein AABZ41_06035 [Bacteroidota bacterium]